MIPGPGLSGGGEARQPGALQTPEAKLLASEKRLAGALRIARLGAFEWDLETNAVWLDERARAIFGFAEGAGTTAQEIFDRIHPDDLSEVHAAAMRAATDRTRLETEYRIRLPDGRVRTIGSFSDAVSKGDGEAGRLVGVFVDVTERRADEETLRRSERRQRFRVELGETVRALGSATEIQATACRLLRDYLGASRVHYAEVELDQEHGVVAEDHALGVPPLTGRFRLRDLPALAASCRAGRSFAFADLARDARIGEAERARFARMRVAAAVVQPIVKNARLAALLAVHRDAPYAWSAQEIALIDEVAETTWVAVEKVRAEAGLRELNASLEQQVQARTAELRLYRNIVQSDQAPILAFDTAYRLTGFNRAHDREFLRLTGRRQQVGDVLPDLFPPEQASALRALMDRALDGETFTVVEDFGGPAGVQPTWEITYTPLRDEGGAIVGAFHHARDISARLRTERDLDSVQEQLRQSQKMEAVGQLTGGVAHDFNNLLTVVKSSAQLLKRPGLPEDRRARYIAAISDTVDRAAKLTGQLLAFARRQALQPEVFDVAESVRTIGEMIGTLTGARIRIVTHLAEEPCFVNADPSQFDTALVNMAVNARDAMDGEGQLTVRVEAVTEADAAARPHLPLSGAFVAVSLTDTGCGIPSEQQQRIFEPFFTTKGVGQGTGLGLSQVYGFAKQSGGEVVVRSEVGGGSTFTLLLPRVAAGRPKAAGHEPAPPLDGRGTCVLVVEDNEDVGTFATQTLAELGYGTVWAASAAAALAELDACADRFDVVFSDVVMPGMNGIELAHEIRRRHVDLPVILTSGYSHVLAKEGTFGFELLNKPYSVEQLAGILRKIGKRRRRADRTGR